MYGCELLELLPENIRRLEAWHTRLGTRRPMAEHLARECEKHLPPRDQHHYRRWAFLWEMTGAREELHKLLGRLMPEWYRRERRCLVSDPTTKRPQPPHEKETPRPA